MKLPIWVITFCPLDDMTTVKIAYSAKEADLMIKAYFGEIMIDMFKNKEEDELVNYIKPLYTETDADGYINYAEWKNEDFKEFISVNETEVEV